MSTNRTALIVAALVSAVMLPNVNAFAGGRSGGSRGGNSGSRGGGSGNGNNNNGDNNGGWGNGMGNQPQLIDNPIFAADQQAITDAQNAMTLATKTYANAVTSFQADYKKQPQIVDDKKALDDATKAEEAQEAAVIKRLKSESAAYKAAIAKETAAKKKLDELRLNEASRDAIANQSKVVFDAGEVGGKIEADALDADATYQKLKDKVAAARAALDSLEAKMTEATKNDATLKKLASAKDDAATTFDKAKKKLASDKTSQPQMIAPGPAPSPIPGPTIPDATPATQPKA